MGVKVPRHFLEMVEIHRVIGVWLELDNGGDVPNGFQGHVQREGREIARLGFQWRKEGRAGADRPPAKAIDNADVGLFNAQPDP